MPTPYLWGWSMNWYSGVLIMALWGLSCRASSVALELITAGSHGAQGIGRKQVSVQI